MNLKFKKQKLDCQRVSLKRNGGQVVIMTVLFFVIISLLVISGVSIPTSNQIKSSRDFFHSRQSYFAADAANEDALYRLNQGKTLPSSIVLSFSNNISATASITNSGNSQQIKTIGDSADSSRISQSVFSQGTGVSFGYGAQVGAGGMNIVCGTVSGNVYSNGNISGTSCSVITGSATVANRSDPLIDQTNNSTTSNYDLVFGDISSKQDVAQSFKVGSTTPVTFVRLYIKKIGNPADAIVRIVTDSYGKPSGTTLGSGVLSASLIGTNYNYLMIPISPSPALSLNTTYWIVIDNSSVSSANYYAVATSNNTYANGYAKVGQYDGSWNNASPSTSDIIFDIYLGGNVGLIKSTVGQNNPITIGGSAWAHEIDYAKVSATSSCQNSLYIYDSHGNAKNCDTSKGSDPVALAFPVSDSTIQNWKDQSALGGTHSGNLTINATTTTINSEKIIGNLSVVSGGHLKLKGPIWVTGTISVSGDSDIVLDSSVGSKDIAVVSDGPMNLSGTGSMAGSGVSGSYIVAVTTSNSSLAVQVSGGGSGSNIIVAPYGTVIFTGGSGTSNIPSAKEVSAYAISLDGNSFITYDEGLKSMNFLGGQPGPWKVDSWQEVAN